MHKLNYLLSVILVIFMSFSILFLSSDLVLRTSATYTFHFNDSEVMYEIPYSIKGSDMSKEITSYFMSFSKKPFQVYEDNRIFKDPILEKEDQEVMKKAKNIINIELLAGLLCFAAFVSIYIYMYKKDFKKALRNRFVIGIALTIILLISRIVLWCIKSFRTMAYTKLIGIKLSEFSVIGTILGDPFYKTYVIFATVAAIFIIGIMTYIHYKITKPERIFY